MEDVVGDVRDERPVVADQQDCLVGIPEVVLEPPSRFQIEMICRLVE
jgi:hypothetical protein